MAGSTGVGKCIALRPVLGIIHLCACKGGKLAVYGLVPAAQFAELRLRSAIGHDDSRIFFALHGEHQFFQSLYKVSIRMLLLEFIIGHTGDCRNAVCLDSSQNFLYFIQGVIIPCFHPGELSLECFFHQILQRTGRSFFVRCTDAHVKICFYTITVDDHIHSAFGQR